MSSPEEKAGAPRPADHHITPDRAGEPEAGDQAALLRELRQEIEQRKQIERELRQEIEEMKQREASLRSGHQRLQDYFDLSMLGVAISSLAQDWVEVNDTFCKMLGYSREELAHKTWAELTHPDDLAKDLALYDRILSGELDAYELNKRYVRKDGEPVEVLLSVKGVRQPDRSIDYVAAFVLDITSHVEAERRLRASEQRLMAHFKSTPLAVIEWTVDLRVSSWNPAACRTFGYTEEEALNMHGSALVPKEVRPQIDDLLSALATGTGGNHSINENVTKDGRVIICEWFNSMILDENGACIGISNIAQDITSRVRAEEELRAHVATIERQKEAILAMSAPLIQVWDGVLALPLIGLLDSARAGMIMERLLARIVETRSHHAIVDLTGVEVVDSAVARHLEELLRAMKLLGTRAVVTGIHPAVAQTMVSVGLGLSGVAIRSTMQDALKLCVEEGSEPGVTRARR